MTVPQIKVTVVRKPQLKLKVLPRFPSNITVASPILLDRTGGNYGFSLDVFSIGVSLQALFLPASGIDASSVISGTFAPARLPNPTSTTLGGVKSKTAVSHQWLNSIGTNGLPTSTQPDGSDVTFTQSGTGATATDLTTKARQTLSVKDFGVAASDINKAIVEAIARSGHLIIPAGTYTTSGTTILVDLSAISTRFQGRIIIEGDGAGAVFQNTTSAGPCFKFLGSTSNTEAYFELRNIRFQGAATPGAAVTGSKGLEIDVCAFAQIRGVVAEGFEYGIDCTDVEQLEISNCEFRWNKNGGVFRGVGSVTDTNSVLITNTQFTNNSLTGVTVNHPNCWVMNGGSNQYNGLVGGASNTGGAFFQEAGTGYGNVVHIGVAFEGNGGIGDFDSLQTTNPGNYSFIGCGFMRTQTFGPTVGYGTNNFNARGTNANTIYRFSGCTFRNAGGYSVSAARPTIALANTSCKIADDGTNYFQSATETLTYPVGQIAAPVFGNVSVGGTLDVTSDFRVNTNKLVITGSNGNAAFAGLIFAAQGIVGGALPASAMTVASTSSGAPSGDILNLVGSAVKLNTVDIAGITKSWTSYTPTVTAQTPGVTPPTFTVNNASYWQVGKTVTVRADVTVTAAGTGSAGILIALPFTAAAFGYLGASKEIAVTGVSGAAFIAASGTTMNCQTSVAGTYIVTGQRVLAEVTYAIP